MGFNRKSITSQLIDSTNIKSGDIRDSLKYELHHVLDVDFWESESNLVRTLLHKIRGGELFGSVV